MENKILRIEDKNYKNTSSLVCDNKSKSLSNLNNNDNNDTIDHSFTTFPSYETNRFDEGSLPIQNSSSSTLLKSL